LFLILVTDLPPSIALGMEPGDSTILEDRPRPKEEPVVLNWMWVSMVINGAVLSAVIIAVYIIALATYCDGQIFQNDINEIPGFADKLMDARTVAFISLVWAENVRSYTSRSFDRPVWHDLLGNVNMQKAIILAQIALYIAVLVPFFSTDILQLRGINIGIGGWLLALVGPVGCLVLCELAKLFTAYQMKKYQASLAAKHDAEDKRLAAAAASRAGSGSGSGSSLPPVIKAAAPKPQHADAAPATVAPPIAPAAQPKQLVTAVASEPQETTVKFVGNIRCSIASGPPPKKDSDCFCFGVNPTTFGGRRYSSSE